MDSEELAFRVEETGRAGRSSSSAVRDGLRSKGNGGGSQFASRGNDSSQMKGLLQFDSSSSSVDAAAGSGAGAQVDTHAVSASRFDEDNDDMRANLNFDLQDRGHDLYHEMAAEDKGEDEDAEETVFRLANPGAMAEAMQRVASSSGTGTGDSYTPFTSEERASGATSDGAGTAYGNRPLEDDNAPKTFTFDGVDIRASAASGVTMEAAMGAEMKLTGGNKGGTRIWRKRGVDGGFKDTCCISGFYNCHGWQKRCK